MFIYIIYKRLEKAQHSGEKRNKLQQLLSRGGGARLLHIIQTESPAKKIEWRQQTLGSWGHWFMTNNRWKLPIFKVRHRRKVQSVNSPVVCLSWAWAALQRVGVNINVERLWKTWEIENSFNCPTKTELRHLKKKLFEMEVI